MTAVARQRPPRALVLRVRSLGYQVQCLFVGNKIFEEAASYVADNDQDIIWAVDFLETRAPTPEVLSARAEMPSSSQVLYLRPAAQDNPMLITHTNDEGHEMLVQGPWSVLMTADSFKSMAKVVQSYFVNFMGIHKPLRDNGFYFNGNPKAKFVTRKNRHPQINKTWNTNYTVRFEYVGEITPDVMDFITTTIGNFPFLQWSGAWSFDGTNGDFSKVLPCHCTGKEEVEQKELLLLESRLNIATSKDTMVEAKQQSDFKSPPHVKMPAPKTPEELALAEFKVTSPQALENYPARAAPQTPEKGLPPKKTHCTEGDIEHDKNPSEQMILLMSC